MVGHSSSTRALSSFSKLSYLALGQRRQSLTSCYAVGLTRNTPLRSQRAALALAGYFCLFLNICHAPRCQAPCKRFDGASERKQFCPSGRLGKQPATVRRTSGFPSQTTASIPRPTRSICGEERDCGRPRNVGAAMKLQSKGGAIDRGVERPAPVTFSPDSDGILTRGFLVSVAQLFPRMNLAT